MSGKQVGIAGEKGSDPRGGDQQDAANVKGGEADRDQRVFRRGIKPAAMADLGDSRR